VAKRHRKITSVKVKAVRRRFAKTIDTCIVVASKAPAGTRMKALGRCVKRILKK
jgi:hypothetical protein